LIGDAIPHTLIYWAPEVLKLEKFSQPADMWALGITLYQMVTGEHPFNIFDENEFREDVFSAAVDWTRLDHLP
jgi:serine/threonine protein kinase